MERSVNRSVKRERRGKWIAALSAVALATGALAGASWAATAAELQELLAAAPRPDADQARDADRRPADVLAFLGVEPGMVVLDLIAAGGYYTEVLAVAVGESGKVYAQNPEFVLQMRGGVNERELAERTERHAQIERVDRDVAELGLEPGSVDLAITALNYHDVANRSEEAAQVFLAAVFQALEPGGIFGLIDHAGDPANDNRRLHRIPVDEVLKAVEAAGFERVAEGEMLRHPEDDRTQGVFSSGLRGKTDRFVLKLRRPVASSE